MEAVTECCQGSNPTGRLCRDCPAREKPAAASTDILDPVEIAKRLKASGRFDKDEPWPGWNAGKKLIEKEPAAVPEDDDDPDTSCRRGVPASGPRRMSKAPKSEPLIDGMYRSERQRDIMHADGKQWGLSPNQVDEYMRGIRGMGKSPSKGGLKRYADLVDKQTRPMAAFADADFNEIEKRVLAHIVGDCAQAALGTIMHGIIGEEIDIADYDQFEDALVSLEETMEKTPKWHTGGLVTGRLGAMHDLWMNDTFVRGHIMTKEQAERMYGYNSVTIPFKPQQAGKTDELLEVRYVSPDAAFTDEKGDTRIIEYKTHGGATLPRIVFDVKGMDPDAMLRAEESLSKFKDKHIRDMLIHGSVRYEGRFVPNTYQDKERLMEMMADYCRRDVDLERELRGVAAKRTGNLLFEHFGHREPRDVALNALVSLGLRLEDCPVFDTVCASDDGKSVFACWRANGFDNELDVSHDHDTVWRRELADSTPDHESYGIRLRDHYQSGAPHPDAVPDDLDDNYGDDD